MSSEKIARYRNGWIPWDSTWICGDCDKGHRLPEGRAVAFVFGSYRRSLCRILYLLFLR